MIYEVRTYTLKPGSVAEFEERFGEALPGRQEFSPLAALWHTEMGPLNQVIHVWPYEDLNERNRIRAEAVKSGKWPPQTAHLVLQQEAEIVTPAPFMQRLEPATLGNFYEMRIYTYQVGSMPEVIRLWSEAVPDRIKISPLAACWYSELGTLNRWTHIWPYQDLNERMRLRAEGMKLPSWPPPTRQYLLSQEVKLLVPAACSPLK